VYCVLCTMYCVLPCVYVWRGPVLCTVYSVLCTVYCLVCTCGVALYCVLCTLYYVLCTALCVRVYEYDVCSFIDDELFTAVLSAFHKWPYYVA